MSGESTPRTTVAAEALERAFGARAVCNACATPVEDYRVVALFLHETAVVRAYCRRCYPAAAEGEHSAAGDGLLLDYASFAARFGAPGPPPPPATAVDRALTTLVRDPALYVRAVALLARERVALLTVLPGFCRTHRGANWTPAR